MKKETAPKISWHKGLKEFRAITIRQPYAWLIVNGYKDVENWTWPTSYRGSLLIHAGLNPTALSEKNISQIERRFGIQLPREYDCGGVVALVEVVGCEARTNSLWHKRGSIGWILSHPTSVGLSRGQGGA